jgi:type IV pilus assembly protein PilV
MFYRPLTSSRVTQKGSSLIEVLVAMLVMSFGLLAMAATMVYAIQMPKLAAYRAMASNLAEMHVERIRANRVGFLNGSYDDNLSYDGTLNPVSLSDCTYPNCTASTLAVMDKAFIKNALRRELPAGGMRLSCDTTPCNINSIYGNLWVIWQEPSMAFSLNSASSDNCPAEVASFNNPRPRCLYLRFKL